VITEKAAETKEPAEKHDEKPSTDETPDKTEEATTASVKRTPRKKRESATGDAGGDKPRKFIVLCLMLIIIHYYVHVTLALLETPLVVEGKRSRQKTDRLDTSDLNKRDISGGSGVRLGDISYSKRYINDKLLSFIDYCIG